MPPSRSMKTDSEMSVQEPETTHVAHPSTSETILSDLPVASVELEDSVHASHSVQTSSNSVGPCGTSETY